MPKIITIAQQKGGVGKTTIVAHLAVAFSQTGKRVAVIDIDPQGSLTQWHKIRENRFGEGQTGLAFSNISGWRLPNEIDRVKNDSDVIIIDSPPHTQAETKTAIRIADFVIIPAQPSPTDLWATAETVRLVTDERVPHRILLNRAVYNSRLLKDIEQEFSSVMAAKIGNRIPFASAMLEGRTVTETAPSGTAAEEIKAILKEVSEKLFPGEKPELQVKKTKARRLEEVVA
jgi:chromosome partitioning protein